jgi:hypothetical protein
MRLRLREPAGETSHKPGQNVASFKASSDTP